MSDGPARAAPSRAACGRRRRCPTASCRRRGPSTTPTPSAIDSPFAHAPAVAVKATPPPGVRHARCGDRDELVVEWDAPENDGGEPVLECREVEWRSNVPAKAASAALEVQTLLASSADGADVGVVPPLLGRRLQVPGRSPWTCFHHDHLCQVRPTALEVERALSSLDDERRDRRAALRGGQLRELPHHLRHGHGRGRQRPRGQDRARLRRRRGRRAPRCSPSSATARRPRRAAHGPLPGRQLHGQPLDGRVPGRRAGRAVPLRDPAPLPALGRRGRFGVRVAAGNAAGYGNLSAPVYLKPYATADAPEEGASVGVPGAADQLRVQWRLPLWPADRQSEVTAFVVEYSTCAGLPRTRRPPRRSRARSCGSTRLTCAGGDCDVPGGYQVLYDAPTAADKVLRNDEFDWQMANPNKARSGVWMRHTLAGLEQLQVHVHASPLA